MRCLSRPEGRGSESFRGGGRGRGDGAAAPHRAPSASPSWPAWVLSSIRHWGAREPLATLPACEAGPSDPPIRSRSVRSRGHDRALGLASCGTEPSTPKTLRSHTRECSVRTVNVLDPRCRFHVQGFDFIPGPLSLPVRWVSRVRAQSPADGAPLGTPTGQLCCGHTASCRRNRCCPVGPHCPGQGRRVGRSGPGYSRTGGAVPSNHWRRL